MHSRFVYRVAFVATMLCLLVACAPNQPAPLPAASVPAANVVVALPAVLAEPQRWSGQELTLITPVYDDGENRLLTIPLPESAANVDERKAIWLAQPLPSAVRQEIMAGNAIVKLRGILSPPGAYGREQRFAYQFVANQATGIAPERTTIANLALNPQALDQILLRLEGTLLAGPDAALLADEVGAGGVPKASGHQIKLARDALHPTLLQSLTEAGNVRWGKIEALGWWQNGTLTPLVINQRGGTPSPATEATPDATSTP